MSNFRFCEIQKSHIPPSTKIEKNSRICKFSIDNSAVFYHFWGHKYTSKSIDFPFFGVILDEFLIFYPTDEFFSSIFDFFPKKTDFQVKKLKKIESPKMVLKRH